MEDLITTTNHNQIQKWIEERHGKPSIIKGTNINDGILSIDFPGIDLPGYNGQENLTRITWEQFFEIFDRKNLKFLYQEKAIDGRKSRFYEFILE